MNEDRQRRLITAVEEQARVLQVIAKQLETMVELLQKTAKPMFIVDQGKGTVQPYEGYAKRCPICGKGMTRYGAGMVCHYCEDERGGSGV